MSWIIVGKKEGKNVFKLVKNDNEALRVAVDWTKENDEVLIFEVKSKLILRNPREGEE